MKKRDVDIPATADLEIGATVTGVSRKVIANPVRAVLRLRPT